MINEEVVGMLLDRHTEEGVLLLEAFGEEQEALEKEREALKKKRKVAGQEQARAGQAVQHGKVDFEVRYQSWYSRTLMFMQQVAPDRYAEFQACYQPDPKRDKQDGFSYVIQDYFRRRPNDYGYPAWVMTHRCFYNQLAILKSVRHRLVLMALDTEDPAERGLQLTLLNTARDLIKVSERAAGALAGTVLQGFLSTLAAKHKVRLRKQSPPVGELVDALKAAKVLDVPAWSQATWLAEIRERCHKAGDETLTKLQVRDLIDGTHWLLTNVF